jgi:hypothetical protein
MKNSAADNSTTQATLSVLNSHARQTKELHVVSYSWSVLDVFLGLVAKIHKEWHHIEFGQRDGYLNAWSVNRAVMLCFAVAM